MKFNLHHFALLFIFVAFSCRPAQQAPDPNSPTSTLKDKIKGVWRLIELADLDSATKKWNYPYGKNPKGYFIYGEGNAFTINISSESALKMPMDSALHFNLKITDLMEKYYLGFFGSYSIDTVNSVIVHHVTGGSIPFYTDTDQLRPFLFRGDTLVIGDDITWKRVMVRVQ